MGNHPEQANPADSQPPAAQAVNLAAAPEPTVQHEEEFIPSGAFRFALALIIFYAIYFFLTWHEIVILRGGA
jgi:hypothetical protein